MTKPKPIIFRDFDHWFNTSQAHGMSSASRDWMKEIWDEIEPTIKASQDDYKLAYVELMKEVTERHSEMMTALMDYVVKFRQPGQPTFFRWWAEQVCKEQAANTVVRGPSARCDNSQNPNSTTIDFVCRDCNKTTTVTVEPYSIYDHSHQCDKDAE